jgi:hypothetical protein
MIEGKIFSFPQKKKKKKKKKKKRPPPLKIKVTSLPPYLYPLYLLWRRERGGK